MSAIIACLSGKTGDRRLSEIILAGASLNWQCSTGGRTIEVANFISNQGEITMLGRHSDQMSRIGAIACVLGLAVAQAGIAAGAGDVTQKIRKTGTTKKQSTKRPPAPQDSTGHLRLQNPLGHLTLKQPATDIHRAIKERYNKTNEAMQSTRLVPIPILLNRRLADEKNDNKNRQGKRKKNKQKKDKAAK